MKQMLRRWIRTGVLAGALMAPAWAVFADAKTTYTDQAASFRVELTELADKDSAGTAAEDISRVRQWLDEADQLLADRDVDEAAYLLKRVEYGLELVRKEVAVSQIKAKAGKQIEAAEEEQAQIEALEAEVEELRAQKMQLQKQLARYQ